MGAIRSSAIALLSAGATGAALALGASGAPAALAAEAAPVTSFGFAITPSTVAPGGQAVLSVSGCGAAYATASSGVFDTVSIARGQTARITVDRDARRGALYSVSFTCNGETGSADLVIAGGTSKPTTSSTSGPRPSPSTRTTTAPAPKPKPTPTRTPSRTAAAVAPRVTTAPPAPRATTATVPRGAATTTAAASLGVRGGLGGSVAGTDPLELGAGAVLFLGAAGGVAYALRRRGTARHH
ncbi:hypothetical protein [Streptomyces sp. SPB4]|uniref:hypothetical protein n=1 Tax=Streptomyces sp. SPB4 TaxID=2940553 RepID=UPI002474E14F|nr:hypothetical protein [Streptomyces sp. SPB4]MDH6537772.1 hypothetical protein [Streptomyces sp. SPB4]